MCECACECVNVCVCERGGVCQSVGLSLTAQVWPRPWSGQTVAAGHGQRLIAVSLQAAAP